MKRLLGTGLALVVITKIMTVTQTTEGPLQLRDSLEASILSSTFTINIPEETKTLLNLLETVIDRDRDYEKGAKIIDTTQSTVANKKILELYKARILLRTLDFEKALELLTTIGSAIDPQKFLMMKAAVFIALNDRNRAGATLHKIMDSPFDEQTKTQAQALLNVYRIFDRYRDVDESYIWTLFAQQFGDFKEFEISHYLAEKAVKRRPEYRDAWIIKGYDELMLNKFVDAEVSLLTAYQFDSGNTNIQYLLGLVYFELKKPELSTKYLLYAKTANPKYMPLILEKLAENAITTKEFALASYYYQSLLLITEDRAKVYQKLIWISGELLSQFDKALEYANQYVQEFPEDGKSISLKSFILGKMGRFEEANALLKQQK